MSIKYTIHPQHKFVYIQATGKIQGDDIIALEDQLLKSPKWANGFSVLLNYGDVDTFNVTSNDIFRLVQQNKRNEPLLNQSKCAVVTHRNVIYGVSRMWQSLAASIPVNNRIFRNLNESLEWLNIPADTFQSIARSSESDDA